MKSTTHHLRALAFLFVLALPAVSHALDHDFELVNGTGYAIKEIYISPAAADNWQNNVLPEPMADGQSATITLSSDENPAKWDMKIVWVDPGEDVVWQALSLPQISKLTLRYNADDNSTTAEVE
jgi:hypothetical protein